MTEEDTFNVLRKSNWATLHRDLADNCDRMPWTCDLVTSILQKHGWSLTDARARWDSVY